MLIAQLTDLHVCSAGRPAARVVETNMLTERALRAVAGLRPAPDFVVISGDLTENGLIDEYKNLAALLERYLTMPIFVVPGNHDRRSNLRQILPHLPGVSSDSRFIQYVVEEFPVRLIMLDTVVPGHAHGELGPERLDFLDRSLTAAPHRPSLVVMHHPPFRCGVASMDSIHLRDSAAFTSVIARHQQVDRILSGHHHRMIIGRVAQAIAMVAPSIAHQWILDFDAAAPAALVMEPPAFMLHHWAREEGMSSHAVYVESYPGPFPGLTDPEYPGHGGAVS
ncbi:phosphodiesterase [Acidiphilium iwatense]|uniref:Phosphodiesterase n=1 Tax=Acidiphilium iwatense TaxID=768198 RepID=A0ABS9E2I4_9PROT|nr:phosphodiesterase [Acidiphilium iwatense]MCF3947862.1 phosphodiesterase [Acidiphilium iwatense]